jgi:hypothetical protein
MTLESSVTETEGLGAWVGQVLPSSASGCHLVLPMTLAHGVLTCLLALAVLLPDTTLGLSVELPGILAFV